MKTHDGRKSSHCLCVCFKYNSEVVLFQPAKLLSVACNAMVKFPVLRLVSDVC